MEYTRRWKRRYKSHCMSSPDFTAALSIEPQHGEIGPSGGFKPIQHNVSVMISPEQSGHQHYEIIFIVEGGKSVCIPVTADAVYDESAEHAL